MTRRAVLFLHGFMGGPRQFDRLLLFVKHHGLDAFAPTLPGHGGDVDAFHNATDADWLACARREIDGLRETYDEILIVTHSMGGLLAVIEAVRNKDKIKSIVALALPLRIRVTPACLKIWLSVGLFPDKIKSERIAAARDACTVSGITARNSVQLLPGALALLRLCKQARRAIGSLRVPMLALQSPRDEIVSPSSATLARKAGARVRTLPSAGHFWYAENDARAVEEALFEMISVTSK